MDLWGVIAEERASLIETFEQLSEEQWSVPSLCGHWTVREVLGHLVIATHPPMGRFGLELLKAGGSFDKANDRLAVAEASRPIRELLEQLRGQIDHRFAPPGMGPRAPLSDILLHSLDVRISLGLPAERPVERYVPAMELLLSRKAAAGFTPRGRPGLRWLATDHAWSGGQGDEVHGTMADLALAASGRAVHLDTLSGAGQSALVAWLAR